MINRLKNLFVALSHILSATIREYYVIPGTLLQVAVSFDAYIDAFFLMGFLLGDRNLIGARVTEARLAQGMKQVELLAKLQLAGVDMSVPALSLLEGQKRPVSDIELNALADILNVSVDWLLGRKES